MFGDYLIFDKMSERYAKSIYKKLDTSILLKKSIISIGGISGTRKSETAFKLAEYLINAGKQCHIISGDDYYKTPWHTRNDIRKKDQSIIGPDELDWERVKWTMKTFRDPLYNNIQIFLLSKFTTSVIQAFIDKKDCDILIFEGLYGCHPCIDSNLKVHIGDTSPESTFKFRKDRKKEDECSDFRRIVVESECKAVDKLSKNADLVIK